MKMTCSSSLHSATAGHGTFPTVAARAGIHANMVRAGPKAIPGTLLDTRSQRQSGGPPAVAFDSQESIDVRHALA